MAKPLLRKCYRCKESFTIENCSFGVFRRGTGLCRKCEKLKSAAYWTENREREKAKQAIYRSKHPELFKLYYRTRYARYKKLAAEQRLNFGTIYHRKKYLGVEPEQFDAMLILQDGRCEICNEPMVNACLDHDHKTGQIRDILCQRCNKLLGNATDSIEILLSAIRYLEKHTKRQHDQS